MALTNCRECGREVSDQADKCPGCGVTIKRKAGFFVQVGRVLAVLLLGFVGLNWYLWKSDPEGSQDAADRMRARYQCEDAVSSRLKSPASARFSNTQVSGSGSSLSVTGFVDSQNGF